MQNTANRAKALLMGGTPCPQTETFLCCKEPQISESGFFFLEEMLNFHGNVNYPDGQDSHAEEQTRWFTICINYC